MNRQYNFSNLQTPPVAQPVEAALAIDTGSPVVSVAVSVGGQVVAERAIEQRQSSGRLLQMIDEALEESGLQLFEIDLLLGLRGPGSFTGLRVGLATLQGIRMALATQTATFPTLQVLATLAPAGSHTITACVDALRGQWLMQDFMAVPPYRPLDTPETSSAEDFSVKGSHHFVGFGISRWVAQLANPPDVVLIEPGPLAPQALRILDVCPAERDPDLLANPLYLRAPAVTPPSPAR
jgi:tRNA threonylcarbamoyl adenosine modification protein YeaZ